MDKNKYQSMGDISEKPRNNFSQRALRMRVGEKRVKGTMSCIRIPSALVNSNLYNKTKSMENVIGDRHKGYKGSIDNVKKIMEEPDEEDKNEDASGADKVKGFLIADEDSDGSSSSEDDDEKEEDDRKDTMELVDDDLKKLLLSFDLLERPSAAQIKELKVEFGEISRQKTLILDMDETLIHTKPKIKEYEDFEPDFEITLEDDDLSELIFMVKMRPGLVE
mmetsp:Transcript_12931/g.14843  ORF Transcript_12931/g.14843 Transcript_12931/m.14843 type:complete len:221 (-) Transcript_12931:473-1135(-)